MFIPARIRQQRNRRCQVCQNMPPLSEEPPRPDYHSFVFHHYNLSFFSQVEFQHILSFIIIYVFFLPETPQRGSTSFPVLISSNHHLQWYHYNHYDHHYTIWYVIIQYDCHCDWQSANYCLRTKMAIIQPCKTLKMFFSIVTFMRTIYDTRMN